MAEARKPYTFAKRGINREILITEADSTFMVKVNFKYIRIVGDHVEFRYRVDKARLDVMEEFKRVASQPGNAIYVKSLDFHAQFAISDKCAVEVNDVEDFWEPSSLIKMMSGGKRYSVTFNPTDKEHYKIMINAFEEFFKNDDGLKKKLKVFLDATAVKARGEMSIMMANARRDASNETLRKVQHRQHSVYDKGEMILADIFKGVGGQWHMFHGAGLGQEPNTDISVTAWEALKAKEQGLFIPPFIPSSYVDSTGTKTIYSSGPSSFLITFGVTPYPFAVLCVGNTQQFGSMFVVENRKYHAIAKIKGAFYAQEIRVNAQMEESKLEMACMLAMAHFMKGKE